MIISCLLILNSQRREFLSIEFDNKLLLERLAKVVQHKSIDNEIHHSIAFHQNFKKKLGVTKKRIEMQKITEENQRMLKRIQEVPPAYNHLEWEEEAKRRETIKRCMALYPEYYERLDAEKEQEEIKKSGGASTRSPGSNGKGPASFSKHK